MKSYHHILFWGITVALLTLVFGKSYGSLSQSFFFVTMLLPVVMGTSYFFNYHLVPKFLFTKRKAKFALYTIYMIVISLYFEMVAITLAFMYLANYEYANMGALAGDVVVLAVVLYLFVFIFSFVLLIKRSFSSERNIELLENEKEKQRVGYLTVRADRKNVKIKFDDITVVESLSDYVKIHAGDLGKIITRERISNIKDKLPDNFVRIHRSFIVNKHHVTSFNKENVLVDGNELPISRTYKADTLALLNI